MRLKSVLLSLAAIGMTTSSVVAAAAPVANPAASLSVARAATPSTKNSNLAGGGFLGFAILAGIAAIVIIAVVNDSEDDSDSN